MQHETDQVYVNLATGNKVIAIGGMIACMAAGDAYPYYVEAEQHGSHHPPAPEGVTSVDTIPPYPISRPETQQIAIMEYIASSDRRNPNGESYRIKRELLEFGEEQELPFISNYDGESRKGKFRRLQAHVIDPLEEFEFIDVEEVGTQHHVFLTEDGKNTLRAFEYLLD